MASPSPPSTDVINLAIADLAIYAAMLPLSMWITWKHGKAGMVCWPILVSFFVLRGVSDINLLMHRSEPEEYNGVVVITGSGSIACLSLTLIGLVYEANIILPLSPKSKTEKIILAATHLANTGGIAVATYGGAPSPAGAGGVVSASLNQIGNCLMLFVMFTICWWMWPTWRRITAAPFHPNARHARILLYAAAVGMPFHLVRLAHSTTYAFLRVSSLDPVVGSFATRILLVFLPQLSVALAATIGGWLSQSVVPKSRLGLGNLVVLGPQGNNGTRTRLYEDDSGIY